MADLLLPATIAMEDDLGIVYVVENAPQFWSELEDMLNISREPTLQQLDGTLKRFLALCSAYHEQYLQTPLQLEHACNMLIGSELFAFHSERMCDILVENVKSTTNPHSQLIHYHSLLCYGRKKTEFFRSRRRWQPLILLLMDHILVDIDPDLEDVYFGTTSQAGVAHTVPIEAKLRDLGVRMLYEVCRVQKMSLADLRVFDDDFLDYLFDLVEQTRHMQDEAFNYSVICLIVAFNEQFMVASIVKEEGKGMRTPGPSENQNRVLRVLMRRLGSSKTFGENMIFMLNRAQHTPEDSCMQLLVLKLLYLLFTTPGTSEYFYTNDLCVLVDVFLRELIDLDDSDESLRHTYLRVLNPLLTKTQLRDLPYKRPQIVKALESFANPSDIRDVDPTTRRLADRCLSGEWCVHLRRKSSVDTESTTSGWTEGQISPVIRIQTTGISSVKASSHLAPAAGASKPKTLKQARSMEFNKELGPQAIPRHLTESQGPYTSSLTSLAHSNAHAVSSSAHPPRRRGTVDSDHVDGSFAGRRTHAPYDLVSSNTSPDIAASLKSAPATSTSTPRRSAPPPPVKRRKPPAIPTEGTTNITTIRTSTTHPFPHSSTH